MHKVFCFQPQKNQTSSTIIIIGDNTLEAFL